MHRPPRSRGEDLIRRADALLPILTGLTLTVAVVGLYLARLWEGAPEAEARATGIMTLIFGQLLLAFVLRSPERSILQANYRENRAIALTALGTIATVVAVVLLPGVSDLMKLLAPEWWWWPATLAIAAAATLWIEPFKAHIHRAAETEKLV
jgi:magnesium-transporting ATPase (P-type)